MITILRSPHSSAYSQMVGKVWNGRHRYGGTKPSVVLVWVLGFYETKELRRKTNLWIHLRCAVKHKDRTQDRCSQWTQGSHLLKPSGNLVSLTTSCYKGRHYHDLYNILGLLNRDLMSLIPDCCAHTGVFAAFAHQQSLVFSSSYCLSISISYLKEAAAFPVFI